MLVGLIFWLLVIVAVARFVVDGRLWGRGHRRAPVDILRERYAKGEIDREEFERRKHELEA
jgi:putative membrane protein